MSTKTYIILFLLAAIAGLALAAAGIGTSQIAGSVNEATLNPIAPPPERYYVQLPDGSASDCLSEREARRLHAHKGGMLLYCK